MSQQLQAIENALISINDAVFQELCDKFLYFNNENYSLFTRTGSQIGKQKTIKGTPDTFMMLPNGKYIFVEFTTNSTDKAKLNKDIGKCLSEAKKLNIPNKDISEIIFCTNFKVNLIKIRELKEMLKKTGIKLTIKSLNDIAIDLQRNHRDLLSEYFGLKYDTGQIVSLDRFINEYDRNYQGIATPLNNIFQHREEEVNSFKDLLKDSDFLILSGLPGVGKTKLAIEGIRQFEKNNKTYISYCISYKNHYLLDDLNQYFNNDKNYILFIDDANRIDSFNQILGFYNSKIKGKMKIVITVRDYALETLKKMLVEKDIKEMYLEKLSDENIVDIIQEEPFLILNQDYQKEILRIADGNPRIAIMVSKLAQEKQDIRVLSDVYELFDKYFSTFLKDNSLLDDKLSLKCLGLVAFFNTLPYKESETIEDILGNFDIGYFDFLECVEKLEKLEIINLQYDYLKLPEQNLATYFFYKAFFEKKVLDFEVLINSYFDRNIDRFKDTIIPANNSFGPENVYKKVKPYFQNYLKKENTEKVLANFWFYLEEESLVYAYDIIESLPNQAIKKYEVIKDKTNYNKDFLLELLSNFFIYLDKLNDALELSFEYIKKKPELFQELVERIKNKITFTHKEVGSQFIRQKQLFDLIEKNIENDVDEFYEKIFLEISETFLSFTNEYTEGGRNNSYSYITFPTPASKEVKEIRGMIWNRLKMLFSKEQDRVMRILDKYAKRTPGVVKDLMIFDIDYLIDIIDNHLDKNLFQHCYYVQNQVEWIKRNGISNDKIEKIGTEFLNNTYKTYLILSYDRYRGKEDSEFSNYQEYEKLKENEIRGNFKFEDISDFINFYDQYLLIFPYIHNKWQYSKVLDIVLDENISNSAKLGLEMIEVILNKNNQSNYLPFLLFRKYLKETEIREKLWTLIEISNFNKKNEWIINFFNQLDKNAITLDIVNNLIKKLDDSKEFIIINLQNINDYIDIEPNFSEMICKTIIKKYGDGIYLQIEDEIFFSLIYNCNNCNLLLEELYIIQDEINNHFDYSGDILNKLLNINKNFLIQYIGFLKNKNKYLNYLEFEKLKVVWEIENIEEVLEKIFNLNKEKFYFGISGDFYNAFFSNLDEKLNKKSNEFLFDFVKKYHSYPFKINLLMDVVRHSKKEVFEDIILHYLEFNTNIKDFSKIYWNGNGHFVKGDIISEDIEVNNYEKLLDIVEKSKQGYKLIPIKKHLKEQIEYYKQAAEKERIRRYISKRDY